jgi:hypothetical protein
MQFPILSLATAAALAMAAPASAHESVYAAQLLGSSEVAPATTTGHGTARVTIDFDLLTMRVEASFADLVGNVTAAHIHCCVAPGANVGVATQLPSFTGFPVGQKLGSYDHTFDMSLASSYNQNQSPPASSPGFLQLNGNDVTTAFNSLVAGLDAGKAYLNVHTSSFPGGEIRALLVPVPEPQTYALMLAGLGLVGWAARRRTSA